ncbi:DUF3577 domain-containing protein [Hahella ganghwensis]|uniref:DUF3577 domain-containing protein n=1 Tax=Hahella ganghwensis TaxID=286420 RepID=UPI00037430D4|nr:DUF3577 domain-containing protein [Hahella ganghwensis]
MSDAYDLIVNGVGTLHRLRYVKPSKGKPYYAVTVCAFHGLKDSKQTTFIDCSIVGEQAVYRIEELISSGAFTLGQKQGQYDIPGGVFISFSIGDLRSDMFYRNVDGKQEPVPTIKGRILKIRTAKIRFTKDSDPVDFHFGDSNTEEAPPVEEALPVPEVHEETLEDRVVRLDKSDPNCFMHASQLVNEGYTYDESVDGFIKVA